MTDHGNRNLRLDLLALGLLAVVVFLTLALLTYRPADPLVELVAPLNSLYQPDILVLPQNATVENACGKWGALAASILLTGLGLAHTTSSYPWERSTPCCCCDVRLMRQWCGPSAGALRCWA